MIKTIIRKYTNLSVQAKASIWFIFCTILQKGISFLTGPIFTNLMDTELYGSYSLYLSWFQILTIITSMYLSAGIFTNAMNKFEDDRDKYVSSMQGITISFTCVCFLVYIVAWRVWDSILGLSNTFLILMFIELLVVPSFDFWASKQRFEYQYKKLVLITLAKSFLNPLLGIIAVIIFEQKDLARVSATVFVEVVFCGLLMIVNFVKGKRFFYKDYWRYALKMAIPLLPHYLSGVILNQGDRIVISKICGNSDVALYSVAYNVGMLTQIVINAVGNSLSPWIYENIKVHKYKSMKQKLNMILLLFYGVAFCIMMLSPEVVLIFGKEYVNAAYVIPPVAASTFFIYLYSILATPQFYFEKTGFMFMASIGSAGLNVLLNIIFVNKFGFVAAGYTTLVCYVLYCIGHHLVTKRIVNKYNGGNNIYDTRFVLILSIVTIITSVAANILVKHWIIRYCILGIIAICVIIGRDRLLRFAKSIKND